MNKKSLIITTIIIIIATILNISLWVFSNNKEEAACPDCLVSEDNAYKWREELIELLTTYGNNNFYGYTSGDFEDKLDISTYVVTMQSMRDANGYDFSTFVNPDTGKSCDEERTRVEMIVSGYDFSGKLIYELVPVLVCD